MFAEEFGNFGCTVKTSGHLDSSLPVGIGVTLLVGKLC